MALAPRAIHPRQFFLETIFVVVISGGVGLIISYGFCALVNLAPMRPFSRHAHQLENRRRLHLSPRPYFDFVRALSANRAASVDPMKRCGSRLVVACSSVISSS